MKSLLKIMVFFIAVSVGPVSLAATPTSEANGERNYFQFVISKYHTPRQAGQTVDIYVRYAYKKNLPSSQYPDYRELRTVVLKYMEPSNEFPADVFWEILASNMGNELMKDFPLDGVSIQLNVLDNPNPNSYEPGDHGPTYTVGDIAPLDVHH